LDYLFKNYLAKVIKIIELRKLFRYKKRHYLGYCAKVHKTKKVATPHGLQPFQKNYYGNNLVF